METPLRTKFPLTAMEFVTSLHMNILILGQTFGFQIAFQKTEVTPAEELPASSPRPSLKLLKE